MYYQLPTGKVIQISVEEFLKLTDKDLQFFISCNAGEYISNPFSGSSLTEDFNEEDDVEDYEDIEDVLFDEFDVTDFIEFDEDDA